MVYMNDPTMYVLINCMNENRESVLERKREIKIESV